MEINNVDRYQLADALDVKYTTLTDWINGNSYPRIDKIEMIANYFNVNKSALIEEWAFNDSTEEKTIKIIKDKICPIEFDIVSFFIASSKKDIEKFNKNSNQKIGTFLNLKH